MGRDPSLSAADRQAGEITLREMGAGQARTGQNSTVGNLEGTLVRRPHRNVTSSAAGSSYVLDPKIHPNVKRATRRGAHRLLSCRSRGAWNVRTCQTENSDIKSAEIEARPDHVAADRRPP